MADFFSNLAQTMQSPQMQSALMSITGTPYEVQAPILKQQQEMQQAQQQQQAKAMLDKILSEGDLSDEKILQVYTLSPELGNALVKMRESKAKQAMQQQIAGLVGGGAGDADTMAKVGVLSGNPQLMQYANMLEDRKYRKNAWGEFINQPDAGGSNATWTQAGEDTVIGGAAPDMGGDITTTDLPPVKNYPNTPEGQNQRRADEKLAMEKEKAATEKQVNIEALGSSFNNFEQQYSTQKQAIAEAKKKIAAGGATGLVNQLTGFVGSSPAGSLNADLEVLQANAFLDALVELKKASPTGSTGLGAVTETEGERIVKSKGNLQGKSKAEDLLRYLDNYEKTLDNAYVNITKRTQKVAPNIFQQQETQQNAPSQTKRLKYNPATGDFE